MNARTLLPPSGFVLLEALIALVVVAVGVLGIAKLNAVMLQGTGASKATTEALQIAQDRIEQARGFNSNLAGGCAGLAPSTTTVAGTNASFTVATTYPEITASLARIQVCVTWDGGTCNAPGNRVILRSVLACENSLGTSGRVGQGGAASMRGDFIKTPTGRGQVGGRDYGGQLPAGASANTMPTDSGPVNDGTYTYINPDDGTLELLDASGKVLLSVRKLPCEETPPTFSTISGKVFVGAKNGSPIAAYNNLFVLSSDASYCTVLPYNASWKMPATASGNNIQYFYTYYQCYIGAEWWGNIGIVRTDNANSNDRVCVGNPLVTNDGTLFSKHAQQSTSRAYRGYRLIGPGTYETKGIGETDTLNGACSSGNKKVYIYQPHHFRNHHFVHANITGQGTCQSTMAALNTLVPTHQLGASATATPTVSHTPTGKVVTANNNPGKYYCMSHDDGVSCVNLAPPVGDRETVVSGRITREGGAALTGIAGINDACTETQWTEVGTTAYDYVCRINWSGFPASDWNGTISFNAVGNATLCGGPDATLQVTPTEANVNYTITDRLAQPHPNSIRFDAIPMMVTNVTLNFKVKPNTCGTGPQSVPLPEWTGTQHPRTLAWQSVTGATQYKVYRCSTTGQNNLTACTPTALISTQSGTSYTPPSVSNRETQCYTVRASDGTVDTNPSSVRCVYRSGNSYTYQ